MLKFANILFFSAAILFSHAVAVAQPFDLFWSDRGLGQGAENGDLELMVKPGQSISLFLYASTMNFDYDQICLDVKTSNPFVVDFGSAEYIDFDVSIAGSPVMNRWDGTGSIDGLSGNCIDEWCIAGSPGVLAANNGTGVFFDNGYDLEADAFLLGIVEIQVAQEGCVFVNTSVGDGGISIEGVPIDPSFGSVLIRSNCDTILGDVNRDGIVNLLDVQPFLDTVVSQFSPEADVNLDLSNDLLDVAPFVELLTGN